jgi:RNA polymerase sigma-70 factor (ECF subfamily)
MTDSDSDLLAQQFERHRPRMRAVAYRMLGSVSEAEDAVQESWVRLSRSHGDSIDNLGSWLTTVVARVSLDMLRTRRSRREEYLGTSLPEPVVALPDAEADPEREALVADSVGLAMLIVLDTLGPAERLAFVLHDMFGVPFEEIAPIVGRSTTAARQLASRGRRRLRGATPDAEPDPARHHEIVTAFLAASRAGDFEALMSLLDPDVKLRVDVGPGRPVVPVIQGAEAVASRALTFAKVTARFGHLVEVNGATGLVVAPDGRPISVIAIATANGRIVAFDVVADPAKLGDLMSARLD